MVSDVHVPTELPAPNHLVRELRRRPLLRLHAPIGTGSPCIDGIDAFLFLGHHRLRRRSAAFAAPKPSPSHPCAPRKKLHPALPAMETTSCGAASRARRPPR
ncbi:uncharacterized protein LOC119277146 [Triticum dicoccoides]|uniref:uncharacterized protein LOC119277146 n=1 Tax=Triticum dicoccoides TaxID=85692 RepID=UPI00188DED97|nr:uncharacterized protein LOC119277146 [Triticum dicoccoides]